MRFKQLLIVGMVMTALAACGGAEQRQQNYAPTTEIVTKAEDAAPAAVSDIESTPMISASSPLVATKPNPMPPLQASNVITETVSGRQMVVSADLNFETDSVRKTVSGIEELAKKYTGFVVFSQIDTYTNGTQTYPKADGNILYITRYTHEGNMTLRVPRERSSEFIRELQQHIVFLDKEVFKSEDVGLTLRKQALEAQRQQELAQRLDAINRQTHPATQQTEDAIRAEFEAKARENEAALQEEYWRDKIQFATITLRFRQPEAVMQQLMPNPNAIAKQHSPQFGTVLGNMLKQGWNGFLTVLLYLLKFWPITVVLPLIYMGFRVMRKMRSRRLSRKLTQAMQTNTRHQHEYYTVEEIDDFD